MAIFDGNLIDGVAMQDECFYSIQEAFIADELMKLPDEVLREYMETDEFKTLQERQIIGKGTFVRLSKKDDLRRRKRLAALQMAISKNDPLAKILAKIRIRERECMNKIERKYGNQAEKQQRIAQREYIKKIPQLRRQGITAMVSTK